MRTPVLLLVTFVTATALAADPSPYSGHGAASIRPEQLAKFAPKPVSDEVAHRVQAMLDVREPGSGVLSPDGKRLYFTWTVTGIPQLWMLDGPRRFPIQLTGGDDRTSVMDVTPDGKYVLVQRDRKGAENPGLYLVPALGGKLEVIQHKPEVQTELQKISNDSRYVYYRANDVQPASYAIYRYDLAAHKSERLFGEEGNWSLADVRADGTLLLAKATGALTSEIYEFKDKLVPIVGQGEKEEYEVAYGAKDELLVRTNKPSDFRRLYRFAAGKLEPLTPEIPHDVDAFSVDRLRKRIYYTVNEGGYDRAHVLDAVTHAELALPPVPDAEQATARPGTADGRYAIVVAASSRHPRRSLVLEWKTKKLVEWVIPSAPEIDVGNFAVVQLEHYPARDGTQIPMLVRRPRRCATESCPVVVHFHGGPEGQSRPLFSIGAQLFVDEGFIFVEPNVRGSEGYGKTWLHADDGPKRLQVITDIEDCARYLRTAWAKNGVAPRLGVYGGSYGGYSTLMAMTRFAGAYDAGAAIVGMSSLTTFLMNTAPYRRALRISEYGDPDKDKEALVQLSPVTFLDKVKGPILLIQGATDPRVPVGEALQMHDKLAARKIDAKMIVFPDEGHGARKRDNVVIQYGEVLAFFNRTLR